MKNQFIDALVNRIGRTVAHNISWTNPLAEFKQGLLTEGDTIEEIQTGLVKASSYDADRENLEQELFGTARTEVQVNYHTINREDKYKITVNDRMLNRAFLTENGLSSFVNQLMSVPTTSDQHDEFLATCQLFAEYERNGGFYKVQVPNLTTLQSNEAEARSTLKTLRSVADELTFLSTRYNAAHMPTFAKRDDLVIFASPRFKAAVDVDALASSFNIDSANLHGRIIPIPEERFGIDGAQAIMTTKDFFVIADTLFENSSMWNPSSLHNNYWLHHHQIISASRFPPAVLFTTHEGDEVIEVYTPVTSVSNVKVYDRDDKAVTDVVRGEIYSLSADVATEPAGGVNDDVRWEVTNPTSLDTYVTKDGVLHVGPREGADTLTVTAISTWVDELGLDRTRKSAEATVTVSGDVAPVWPVKEEVPAEPEV